MKCSNHKLFWDIINDLEHPINCLEDFETVLCLYFDNLFDAVRFLDPNKPSTVCCFKGQFEVNLSSLQNILQRDLRNNLGELRNLYEKGFSAYTHIKEVAANENNHSVSTK